MPKVQFIGRVLPSSLQPLTLPAWDVTVNDEKWPLTHRIRIARSLVNIECEAKSPFDDEITFIALVNSVGFARAAINLFAFATAQPRNLILDAFIDSNGVPSPINIAHTVLHNLGTAVSLNNPSEFNELLGKIVEDQPYAMEIINDLRLGISEPTLPMLTLGRAVEGIKHDISGGERDDKKAWDAVRETLNISEAYLRYITTAHQSPRHGRIDYARAVSL